MRLDDDDHEHTFMDQFFTVVMYLMSIATTSADTFEAESFRSRILVSVSVSRRFNVKSEFPLFCKSDREHLGIYSHSNIQLTNKEFHRINLEIPVADQSIKLMKTNLRYVPLVLCFQIRTILSYFAFSFFFGQSQLGHFACGEKNY